MDSTDLDGTVSDQASLPMAQAIKTMNLQAKRIRGLEKDHEKLHIAATAIFNWLKAQNQFVAFDRVRGLIDNLAAALRGE